MRIISGKLKGKSLEFIKSDYTRPLKDSVKENIFNILNHSKEININMRFDAKYPAYAYEPVGLILSKPPVSKKLNKKTIGNDKIEDPGG